jgi:hypothetical protein
MSEFIKDKDSHAETPKHRLPTQKTFEHAAKLSIAEDKPIMLDYWVGSIDKSVMIGVNDSKEKILVRNEEEYTSPISNIYRVNTEFIILTENSIYLVDSTIPTRRIS